MAKPICIAYYAPHLFNDVGGEEVSVSQMNKLLQDKFSDYHVMAIPSNLSMEGDMEDFRLQVFHEKDITELEIGELRKMILKELEVDAELSK